MNDETSTDTQKSGAKVRIKVCSDGKGRWSAINILGVVVAFSCLGPLGLAVLFWVLAGRDVTEIPQALQNAWYRLKGMKESGDWSLGLSRDHVSDNVVFNDYQQTQWDRIQEIRDDMSRRREQFDTFRSNAKRRDVVMKKSFVGL